MGLCLYITYIMQKRNKKLERKTKSQEKKLLKSDVKVKKRERKLDRETDRAKILQHYNSAILAFGCHFSTENLC